MIDSSDLLADPLSDLLRLAGVQTAMTGQLNAQGPWSLAFPAPQGLKLFAVVRGEAWLSLQGEVPRRLASGDLMLMHRGGAYVIGSDPALVPEDAMQRFAGVDPLRPVACIGDGSEFTMIGGHVTLSEDCGGPMAGELPVCLHVRADEAEAPVLRWLLESLMRERGLQRPGHRLMAEQLTQMLFVQMLRLHLSRGQSVDCGWLRAFGDARLQPAVRCMHEQPGRAWTLEELASAAAMSRTAFAVRFKAQVGLAPLAYLSEWRMLLARRALRLEERPMAAWVGELGYASESAFSHAFKRVVGMSPAQYRQSSRQPLLPVMPQPMPEPEPLRDAA